MLLTQCYDRSIFQPSPDVYSMRKRKINILIKTHSHKLAYSNIPCIFNNVKIMKKSFNHPSNIWKDKKIFLMWTIIYFLHFRPWSVFVRSLHNWSPDQFLQKGWNAIVLSKQSAFLSRSDHCRRPFICKLALATGTLPLILSGESPAMSVKFGLGIPPYCLHT